MASSQRFFGFLMIMAAAMALASALAVMADPAGAVELPPVPRPAESICRVALGPSGSAAGWSQVDVSASRSIDFGLAAGNGLTVACGTLGVGPGTDMLVPANTVPAALDPSVKGDFGAL